MSIPQPKPFTYTNLLTIFQYLEPHLRITLSQNIPSIKNVEKSAPLRLEDLNIAPSDINIGSTTYILEVIRFDPVKREVKPFLRLDSRYSQEFQVTWDIDNQGRPVPAGAASPGDIEFDGEEPTKLEDHQQLRKRKRQPPCDYFLKFTTENTEGKVMEYMEYNRNFHTSVKYMNEKILGNRGPIKVKNLGIYGGKFLRLPENLSLEIRSLNVESIRNQMSKVFHLFEKSNFPLEQITLDGIGRDDHEFLKTKEVNILNISEAAPEDIIDIGTPPLPFEKFTSTRLLSDEQFRAVLRDWKVGNRREGTHFQFGTMSATEVQPMILFEFFKNQGELGAVLGTIPDVKPTATFPHCVNFPINDELEINVYFSSEKPYSREENEEEEDDEEDSFHSIEHISLEMKIQKKGYATPIVE